jgi:co-chaperonin GroES (HSP10)
VSRGDENAILNTSGIDPLDLRVLVLPDPVEARTSGGIILPDQHTDRERFAMQFGTLVAAGENAWEEAAARSAAFTKPVPGERIVISKYGGTLLTGKDGKEYRLMNDEDVVARATGG